MLSFSTGLVHLIIRWWMANLHNFIQCTQIRIYVKLDKIINSPAIHLTKTSIPTISHCFSFAENAEITWCMMCTFQYYTYTEVTFSPPTTEEYAQQVIVHMWLCFGLFEHTHECDTRTNTLHTSKYCIS